MISPARRRAWCLRHCQQRAAERYGLHLTAHDFDALCAHLANRPPHPWAFAAGNAPVYLLRVQGVLCKVVFDREAQLVRTFMPPDAYEALPRDAHAIYRDRKRHKLRRISARPSYEQ